MMFTIGTKNRTIHQSFLRAISSSKRMFKIGTKANHALLVTTLLPVT